MNLRVFYLTRRGISDGYVVSSRLLLQATESSRQHNASLKSQPESPIKSFGVCACFFLVFSLSL